MHTMFKHYHHVEQVVALLQLTPVSKFLTNGRPLTIEPHINVTFAINNHPTNYKLSPGRLFIQLQLKLYMEFPNYAKFFDPLPLTFDGSDFPVASHCNLPARYCNQSAVPKLYKVH